MIFYVSSCGAKMLIKFCGLARQEDCDTARQLGADFCGFVFHPASPRYVLPEKAARLATGPVARVGVFTGSDAAWIRAAVKIARLDYVQLHGDQPEALAKAVGAPLIRVLWPARHADIAALNDYARNFSAEYYLLDAGESGGGHGKSLDFARLAALRLPSPWLLAGGLNADNIPAALAVCAPGGIDVNSGAESAPGRKDAAKMADIMRAAGK